jgi:hypothetical protein
MRKWLLEAKINLIDMTSCAPAVKKTQNVESLKSLLKLCLFSYSIVKGNSVLMPVKDLTVLFSFII